MAQTNTQAREAYWRENLRLIGCLLAVWFVVSFCCGILFVDQLNQWRVGGYKLGFWFAQQGAIYCFVVLVFVYAKKMAALDRRYGVDEAGMEKPGDDKQVAGQ